MGLPAGFQAENVAGDFAVAELTRESKQDGLVGVQFRAVPEAESPLWRNDSAAGEEVIPLNCLERGGTGKEEDVDAAGPRDFYEDGAGLPRGTVLGVFGGVH